MSDTLGETIEIWALYLSFMKKLKKPRKTRRAKRPVINLFSNREKIILGNRKGEDFLGDVFFLEDLFAFKGRGRFGVF